ncbi:MAG: hypothetical protein AUI53_01100 [Acidobacteria bacterium 13_1_40CM_2_60_7]|nr:MAG: hypothetical protein AUI53_01100 [Acidobacteria bacterium 13_1_40CM_2_60_7]
MAFNSYVRAIVRGREALTVGVHGHRVADSIVEALENEAAVRVCVAVLVHAPIIAREVKAEGVARQVAIREQDMSANIHLGGSWWRGEREEPESSQ